MTMTNYKRFDEQVWLKFGKDLLCTRGSKKQKDFLNGCKGGKKEFLIYMKNNLLSDSNSVIGDTSVNFVPEQGKFTDKEFINLSEIDGNGKTIWNAFKNIDNEVLFKCGFWGHVILEMIKKECIEPSYLAASESASGVKNIDKALKNMDKEADKVVRRILRSMCNSEPRGKRIVFNDFYLGKSYWRWHWAEKMSAHIKLSPEEIRKLLNAKNYGVFAEKMHTGRSYISTENVLGGLLLYMNKYKEDSKGTEKKKSKSRELKSKKLEKIINQISYLSAMKAIEMQTPSDNQKEIQSISVTIK